MYFVVFYICFIISQLKSEVKNTSSGCHKRPVSCVILQGPLSWALLCVEQLQLLQHFLQGSGRMNQMGSQVLWHLSKGNFLGQVPPGHLKEQRAGTALSFKEQAAWLFCAALLIKSVCRENLAWHHLPWQPVMKREETHRPYLSVMVAGTDVYQKEPKNLAGSVWPGSDHLSLAWSNCSINVSFYYSLHYQCCEEERCGREHGI